MRRALIGQAFAQEETIVEEALGDRTDIARRSRGRSN